MMKNSLIILGIFMIGLAIGMLHIDSLSWFSTHASTYILYALMLQIGISIGHSNKLKEMKRQLHWSTLCLPLMTIVGTLLFSALAGILLSDWSITDCLAVGSGFGYYSLSSLLIVDLKAPFIGTDKALQLGTIALLANIIREMTCLIGTPFFARYFGKYAPITVAGVTSMDVCLPIIRETSGNAMVPIALLHGICLEITVPIMVSFFCQL